jgi:hypothetical protein
MIYVIAGIAKSGKSIVAFDILKQCHMKVISTDWIMMMLFHGNKELQIDVNQSDASVSKLLEPYLEGLIKSLLNSKNDYLIEGVHIQPHFADYLMKKYPKQLKCIFLGYQELDPKIKFNQLKDHLSLLDNAWYKTMSDQELLQLTQYLQKESEKLFNLCVKYNQVYYEVKDIMSDKNAIVKILFDDFI